MISIPNSIGTLIGMKAHILIMRGISESPLIAEFTIDYALCSRSYSALDRIRGPFIFSSSSLAFLIISYESLICYEVTKKFLGSTTLWKCINLPKKVLVDLTGFLNEYSMGSSCSPAPP